MTLILKNTGERKSFFAQKLFKEAKKGIIDFKIDPELANDYVTAIWAVKFNPLSSVLFSDEIQKKFKDKISIFKVEPKQRKLSQDSDLTKTLSDGSCRSLSPSGSPRSDSSGCSFEPLPSVTCMSMAAFLGTPSTKKLEEVSAPTSFESNSTLPLEAASAALNVDSVASSVLQANSIIKIEQRPSPLPELLALAKTAQVAVDFIIELIAGFIYAWEVGALEWE